MLNEVLDPMVRYNIGIEIGGPSNGTGMNIYRKARTIDNVIFSKKTVWATHEDEYNFYFKKKGKLLKMML